MSGAFSAFSVCGGNGREGVPDGEDPVTAVLADRAGRCPVRAARSASRSGGGRLALIGRTAPGGDRVRPVRTKETYPSFTNPSSTIQSSATWCGSCPSTSTFAFSLRATSLSSRAVTGASTPAMAGHSSRVSLLTVGAAL
ncbi:hypothetical protein SUDANB126_04401 [Streptomyces sp. enrichment culture]